MWNTKRDKILYGVLTLVIISFLSFICYSLFKRHAAIDNGNVTSAIVIKKNYEKKNRIYIEYLFELDKVKYIGTISYNNHEDKSYVITVGDTIPIRYNPEDAEQSEPYFDSINGLKMESVNSLKEMLKDKPDDWVEVK
jgi:hypothetical protein